MFREEKFTLDGIGLNVAFGPAGDQPPLLFFHGVTRRWQTFLPMLTALAGRFSVQAVDHRGHGASDRAPGQAYRVIHYVNDGEALVRKLWTRPGFLYGHSLGAMVALAVASRAPELVRGVIIEDPPFHTMGARIADGNWLGYFRCLAPFVGSQLPTAELARQLSDATMTDSKSGRPIRLGAVRDACALRFMADALRRLDPGVLSAILDGRWLEGLDEAAVFAALRTPALVLQADGEMGGMLTDDDVRRLTAAASDCVAVRFPGVGHMIHGVKTQDVLNMIHWFFASI